MPVAKSLVLNALDKTSDSFGIVYEALYELCERYPKHTDPAEIIAKVLLIGRTYAAAIERRHPAAQTSPPILGDRFYIKCVAPAIRGSKIDRYLAAIPDDGDPSTNFKAALQLHAHLVEVFYRLTKQNKRSLASKYLHCHKPNVILINDSRAAKAIRRLRAALPNKRPSFLRVWMANTDDLCRMR